MRKAIAAALVCLLLCLAACGAQSTSTVEVWRVVGESSRADGELLRAESRTVRPGVNQTTALIDIFNSAPEDPLLGTGMGTSQIIGCEQTGTELRFEVTDSFTLLSAAQRAEAQCCMALTFCALDGIKTVSVWSGGAELMPPLSPDDIILADDTAQ